MTTTHFGTSPFSDKVADAAAVKVLVERIVGLAKITYPHGVPGGKTEIGLVAMRQAWALANEGHKVYRSAYITAASWLGPNHPLVVEFGEVTGHGGVRDCHCGALGMFWPRCANGSHASAKASSDAIRANFPG